MKIHAGLAIVLALAGILAAGPQMAAQAPYPNKPIRLIVPYPAGSTTDMTARDIGQLYSKTLGQPVVVDPRPGAAATFPLHANSASGASSARRTSFKNASPFTPSSTR